MQTGERISVLTAVIDLSEALTIQLETAHVFPYSSKTGETSSLIDVALVHLELYHRECLSCIVAGAIAAQVSAQWHRCSCTNIRCYERCYALK